MSNVRDRWELVDPLLFAHSFRDVRAFQDAAIEYHPSTAFPYLRRHFDSAPIARAFAVLGDSARPLESSRPLHSAIRETATRWLHVASGDHWALRIEPKLPGHEIIRW